MKAKKVKADGEEVSEVTTVEGLPKGKDMLVKVTKHFGEISSQKLALQGVADSHIILPRFQSHLMQIERIFRHLKALVQEKCNDVDQYKPIEKAWDTAKTWYSRPYRYLKIHNSVWFLVSSTHHLSVFEFPYMANKQIS